MKEGIEHRQAGERPAEEHPRDASKKQPGCITLVLVPVVIGVLAPYAIDKSDEILLSTVEEHMLEQRLEKPIDLSWLDSEEERIAKVHEFKEIYTEARRNWEFFDQQFAQVGSIELRRRYFSNYAAAVNLLTNSLKMYYNGTWCLARPDNLVHELAHLWHDQLLDKNGFEQQWEAIAGTGYHHCSSYDYSSCFQEKSCDAFVKDVAATRCYAAKNIEEHVAEISSLVYFLQDDTFKIDEAYDCSKTLHPCTLTGYSIGYATVTRDTIPKIQELIDLSAAYQFFSLSEAHTAQERLDGFMSNIAKSESLSTP